MQTASHSSYWMVNTAVQDSTDLSLVGTTGVRIYLHLQMITQDTRTRFSRMCRSEPLEASCTDQRRSRLSLCEQRCSSCSKAIQSPMKRESEYDSQNKLLNRQQPSEPTRQQITQQNSNWAVWCTVNAVTAAPTIPFSLASRQLKNESNFKTALDLGMHPGNNINIKTVTGTFCTLGDKWQMQMSHL